MKIYQVEIEEGEMYERTLETVLCTLDLDKALETKAQYERSFINVWENGKVSILNSL